MSRFGISGIALPAIACRSPTIPTVESITGKDLCFSLGPLTPQKLAFLFEVLPHIVELLNDNLHAPHHHRALLTAPGLNPHSACCTTCDHLPRLRALALLGRRPPCTWLTPPRRHPRNLHMNGSRFIAESLPEEGLLSTVHDPQAVVEAFAT
jgi:hypothetical protein